MAEAVPLDELLHEEAIFGLTGIRKVGVLRGCLFPYGFCLSAVSASSLGMARPLSTRLKRVEEMYRPYGGRSKIDCVYDTRTTSSGRCPSPCFRSSIAQTVLRHSGMFQRCKEH